MTSPIWIDTEDGTRIAAYDFGGDGSPLLLAHATGFHAHSWKPVVARLRDTFHCYAFDERAHGASSPPPSGDFSWRRFGEDARAVAARLELERPCVAGHSAGGALLLLAEQDHPGSWSAVWTFEPVVGLRRDPGEAENPLAAGARKRRAHFDSLNDAYANFASKPPFGHFDPEALRAYVDHGFVPDPQGGVTLACRPDDEATTYEHALADDAFERLPTVTIPVHVSYGTKSTHFPQEMMTAVADRLPCGTLEALSGLSHFAPFESPGTVADSIRKRLA